MAVCELLSTQSLPEYLSTAAERQNGKANPAPTVSTTPWKTVSLASDKNEVADQKRTDPTDFQS
ncbi:hypothetical protein GJ744_003474 [Endocarpon pusillum]|uniref:Uncharacterized protein n=1 Tax=Endocarpon pusillum TaxID=364733 RepID=A0A8H7AME0_9EURO|nr:hypothetical protein GJ744_003474 [Endocarpon pusillum]